MVTWFKVRWPIVNSNTILSLSRLSLLVLLVQLMVFIWRHGGHVGVQNNAVKCLLGIWLYYYEKLVGSFFYCSVHQHGRQTTSMQTKNTGDVSHEQIGPNESRKFSFPMVCVQSDPLHHEGWVCNLNWMLCSFNVSPVRGAKGLENSVIIGSNPKYLFQLSEWLRPVSQSNSHWIVCWRGSRDGWASSTFHSLCNGKGPTVTIIKVNQNIFGGYASISWGK